LVENGASDGQQRAAIEKEVLDLRAPLRVIQEKSSEESSLCFEWPSELNADHGVLDHQVDLGN
jgi:hypothetical protein